MCKQSKIKSIIFPAIIGNMLEWYDFAFFGYFSLILGKLYFPAQSLFLSLLQAYGLVAASYLMRPIGAIFFGYLGDRISRNYSLKLSIVLMGMCSFLISMLPIYADWGMTASVCLTVIRLVQGMAVGGEYSGSAVLLIESAEDNKRTFFGSLALTSAYSGFLLSSLVGTLLSYFLSDLQLGTWGWRIGFALGGLIAIIGFIIRSDMQPQETRRYFTVAPLTNLVTHHLKEFLLAIGVSILPAGFSYIVFVYISNYLRFYSQYSLHEILLFNTLNIAFSVLLIPIIGLISDKFGRKLMMFLSAWLILLFCIPLFGLLIHQAWTIMLLLSLLNAMFEANIPAEIAEMFPKDIRYTGVALTLNITNGVAGGLAPLIASGLIQGTHLLVSPMFYVVGLAMVTIFCMHIKSAIYSRETNHQQTLINEFN